jgi:hypothetical protein
MKDIFGTVIEVGHLVVHPTTSRDTELRVSMVIDTKRDSILTVGCRVKNVWRPNRRVLVVKKEMVPTDIYEKIIKEERKYQDEKVSNTI